jgi:flavin reductase (DIM6/NTAB) family NADH-FMN oxidoreductase RutF
MEATDLRKAMGHFATGVAVLTTKCPSGTLQGITVNSFSSVSLDPPLVLVSISRSLGSFDHFRNCSAFAVHILGSDQKDVSRRFALKGAEKWTGINLGEGCGGVPLLQDCLGLFECSKHASYDGGDHEILVGRVVRYRVTPDRSPLVFFQGGYRSIAA